MEGMRDSALALLKRVLQSVSAVSASSADMVDEAAVHIKQHASNSNNKHGSSSQLSSSQRKSAYPSTLMPSLAVGTILGGALVIALYKHYRRRQRAHFTLEYIRRFEHDMNLAPHVNPIGPRFQQDQQAQHASVTVTADNNTRAEAKGQQLQHHEHLENMIIGEPLQQLTRRKRVGIVDISSRLDEFCFVMARAFSSDPVFSYYFDEPHSRVKQLFAFFRFYAKISTSLLLTYVADHEGVSVDAYRGVSLWEVPHHASSHWDLFFSALAGATALGPRTALLFVALADRLEAARKRIMHSELQHGDAHYHLLLLGIDITAQNQGYGSVALQPILARADFEDMPVYLESSNPRSVPFYERHGFRSLEILYVNGEGSPVITLMLRPPPSAVAKRMDLSDEDDGVLIHGHDDGAGAAPGDTWVWPAATQPASGSSATYLP